ncbi:OB-fold nucleic acid binding domain-containing protein, partial [Georgenia sp. 10Sc9-8]|nr:OB-fold nucleic acid binding domain-containing protein [Georgenia halotolerans]
AELDKQYVSFEAGMRERGYSASAVKTLWDILLPFSDYAFNKAHSAAYGLVSYWTAYLKANHPTEYMAALLTSTQDNKDRLALYLGECRHMDITVLPPDVNTSVASFTPVGTDIRFGLAAIRNVGANVVDAIVRTREEKGPFTSFHDFLDKVPAVVCNKRTIESLVKAGAFDTLGHTRRALVARHEEAVDAVIGVKRNEAVGQFDLFASVMGGGTNGGGGGPGFSIDIPDLPEWEKKEKLTFERQMLGLYVSDHPLAGLEHVLQRAADTSVAALLEDEARPDGSSVHIAGLVTGLQRKMTKNGNPWAIATVEDLSGAIEVLFFPQTYATVSTALAEDQVVTVKGRLNRRDDIPTIYAQEMTLPDLADAQDGPVRVTVPANRCTGPVVEQLRGILSNHPGPAEVRLRLTSPGRATVMRLADALRVDPSPALFGDLKALLGPACLTH